jgi:hypothetical protein
MVSSGFKRKEPYTKVNTQLYIKDHMDMDVGYIITDLVTLDTGELATG